MLHAPPHARRRSPDLPNSTGPQEETITLRTIKDATFDVLRRLELTTIFSNPGSTEVPMLVDLPDDLEFVLGLHEGSVVGMATGWAIGSGRPALVLLHTAAGLGNAVGAIATARANRAPLVVIVGQQDRRHVVSEPFLTGQLDSMAGTYPVWVGRPARAADVPATVARAHHEALAGRGPAIVIVPMNDWQEPAETSGRLASPLQMRLSTGVDERACEQVAAALADSRSPVLIVGAGADDPVTWARLVELSARLGCPVWQEPFGARAGFPQHDKHFAGHLPAARPDVRDALRGHDLILLIGAPALRQYQFENGPLFEEGVNVIVLTDDASEAAFSTADLAFVAPLPAFCGTLVDLVPNRDEPLPREARAIAMPRARPQVDILYPEEVYAALAERIAEDVILVEESPSTRMQLQDLIPARQPLGFLSAAMGGLGFAMPAATGLKMARPNRPVLAVLGDGSSLYAIQALWSAHRYRAGVLFVVLSNGGYAIMDRLAESAGGKAPWPSFADVRVADLATALGCSSVRVRRHEDLLRHLDEIMPTLAGRREPFLIDVVVST